MAWVGIIYQEPLLLTQKILKNEDNEINITKEDAEYVYEVISNNYKTKDKLNNLN